MGLEKRIKVTMTFEMGDAESMKLQLVSLKEILDKKFLDMLEQSMGEFDIRTIGISVGEDLFSLTVFDGVCIISYTNRELCEKILSVVREFMGGGEEIEHG